VLTCYGLSAASNAGNIVAQGAAGAIRVFNMLNLHLEVSGSLFPGGQASASFGFNAGNGWLLANTNFYSVGSIAVSNDTSFSWANNGGWMYTPKSLMSGGSIAPSNQSSYYFYVSGTSLVANTHFVSAGNVAVSGNTGVLWQYANGAMYTPNPIWTASWLNVGGNVIYFSSTASGVYFQWDGTWMQSSKGIRSSIYALSSTDASFRGPGTGQRIQVHNTTGSTWQGMEGLDFLAQCSAELKEEIESYTGDSLALVVGTPLARFKWKGKDEPAIVGLLAEEAPDEFSWDHKSMNLTNMVGHLMRAVQQLAERI
jgi:hypothetical protein